MNDCASIQNEFGLSIKCCICCHGDNAVERDQLFDYALPGKRIVRVCCETRKELDANIERIRKQLTGF